MERMQLMIGRLLTAGVLASLLLVVVGGIFYLSNHATDLVSYRIFHGEPRIYTSFLATLQNAISFSALDIIQLGLFILVITQILRVALTAWIFVKLRDSVFTIMSIFIFAVLLFSFFQN